MRRRLLKAHQPFVEPVHVAVLVGRVPTHLAVGSLPTPGAYGSASEHRLSVLFSCPPINVLIPFDKMGSRFGEFVRVWPEVGDADDRAVFLKIKEAQPRLDRAISVRELDPAGRM